MNGAVIGGQVSVIVLGVITNSIYSVFPVNTLLFLDENGAITDERPTNGYLTVIGKSLGNGSIFINIRDPQRII